jgi:uncharacterized protein YbjQ (UPF0145 family)
VSDAEQAYTEEQERSLARIEAGGIPLSAERRLSELRASSPKDERTGHRTFTSDLSVAGFALCHQLGLKPLSQVMGSSIYQMGYQGAWGSMGFGGAVLLELDTLSQALNEVRSRALARLGQEAQAVGADAVVGMQTKAGRSELETGTVALEHVAVGTAVRREGARASQPVLTELSVSEYAMLVQAGFEPRGIVAWSSVFFTTYRYGGMAGAGGLGSSLLTGAENFELREFTQAIYSARETVMAQLTGQAAALGASGVVGVRIGHTANPHTLSGGVGMNTAGTRELQGLMVTFDAVGTAIDQVGTPTPRTPKTIVDMFS